ncbi:MAG TPA: hypothetical protein VIS94_17525 [Desulfomonilia bacterium]
MKKIVLIALFLSMLILGGCIVSSSPSDSLITMDRGDTLEFSAVVFPSTCHAQWTLQYFDKVQDIATGLAYSFTPDKEGIFQMTLEVTGPRGSTENRIWLINVQ